MTEYSERLNIKLLIAGQPHEFSILRDQEKMYRDAADIINQIFGKYRQAVPHQTQEKYNATVLLHLALQLQQNQQKNDTRPFIDSLTQLTQEIEETLGEP